MPTRTTGPHTDGHGSAYGPGVHGTGASGSADGPDTDVNGGTPEADQKATCRVVIADDNPAERTNLAGILGVPGDIHVVAEVADTGQARDAAALHAPDVVLLDVRGPAADSATTLTELIALAPVLLLTYDRESEAVQQALRLGALGYLVHGAFSDDELLAAIRAVRDTPGPAGAGTDAGHLTRLRDQES